MLFQRSTNGGHKDKVAILYICTGRYAVFWHDFYASVERFFLRETEKHYFVFTDSPDLLSINNANVHPIHQTTEPWPYPTLHRFKYFSSIRDRLLNFDYVIFMNANLIVNKRIKQNEILPDSSRGESLFVTLHPGYFDKSEVDFNYDRNPQSLAYIQPGQGKHYFAGGFNGGISKDYLDLIDELAKRVDLDNKNNIIALWHDESHLNKYMLEYSKAFKIVSPAYLYPQGKKLPFSKKIIILDKTLKGGHDFLRSIHV